MVYYSTIYIHRSWRCVSNSGGSHTRVVRSGRGSGPRKRTIPARSATSRATPLVLHVASIKPDILVLDDHIFTYQIFRCYFLSAKVCLDVYEPTPRIEPSQSSTAPVLLSTTTNLRPSINLLTHIQQHIRCNHGRCFHTKGDGRHTHETRRKTPPQTHPSGIQSLQPHGRTHGLLPLPLPPHLEHPLQSLYHQHTPRLHVHPPIPHHSRAVLHSTHLSPHHRRTKYFPCPSTQNAGVPKRNGVVRAAQANS